MCGICGVLNLTDGPIDRLDAKLATMNRLIAHRGPDGDGRWSEARGVVGFGHLRLSIIDLSPGAAQPMAGQDGCVITYNGEIYNYRELRESLAGGWQFRTQSDTEVILAAYAKWGLDCVTHLRGMFAFAIWDPTRHRLFAARDRFGIKPFYFAQAGGCLYFASEIKAFLPFLPEIATDSAALAEYLTFQFTLRDRTLFKDVLQLEPGHMLVAEKGGFEVRRYWDVRYEIDWDHSPGYFNNRLRELLDESTTLHLRADVPIGCYLSGGVDSSLISILASQQDARNNLAFHGKFTSHPGYDESAFAEAAAQAVGKTLHTVDITADDFLGNIEDVIYHLDHPVAGPGSFPQYMVSKLAAEHVKVVLGGQGGDEVFGGYARYLLAYFEQCIKAAMDGTYQNGKFIVTPESIIPNLGVLREYKPLMKSFFREGMFDSLDRRYFRLIDRSADVADEVNWHELDRDAVWSGFDRIFNSRRNVGHEAYFDSMTHFDFKTLLPALLHVEDRMSMAHGLESRVPFLDHPLIEFAATVPADVKFKDGQMKFMLKEAFRDVLPPVILDRRDKMGFPVPLSEWYGVELKDFIGDLFHSSAARTRSFFNADKVALAFADGEKFSRKNWGLLSLELWQRRFHDRQSEWRKLAD